MALTKVSKNMAIIAALSDLPNATDGLTPAQLKAKFDEGGDSLKDYINNTLIPSLEAIADGNSGADNIGATPIGESPSTVQGILEWLKGQIDSTVLGQIPDGSITDVKLSDSETEIKARFSAHKTNYEQFAQSKGQPNGIADLDSLGNVPVDQLGNVPPNTGMWEKISETVLTSHSTQIDIDLPNGYKRFKIISLLRSYHDTNTGTMGLNARFDNVSTNEYDWKQTGQSQTFIDTTSMQIATLTPKNIPFMFLEFDIYGAKENNWKYINSYGIYRASATDLYDNQYKGIFTNTTIRNTLNLFMYSGYSIHSGSIFQLWGAKE